MMSAPFMHAAKLRIGEACHTETQAEDAMGLCSVPIPQRLCPACGADFAPGGRGLGKQFCTDGCRRSFHARMKAEGGPLAALVKAAIATRHAKSGTREAEICRFARREMTAIAQHLNERDNAAGRASALRYVETLMDGGTLWADRLQAS